MGQPFVGEIRIFAGNFAPSGWLFCEGQTLAISENEVLFQLIGTTYGGDGETTFNVPDLRGRVPVHQGNSYVVGETGGVEMVTLTVNQTPAHTHALIASTAPGTTAQATGNLVSDSPSVDVYIQDTPATSLPAPAVGAAGGSQPHENVMPLMPINYIISLFGIFPSQT